MQPIHRSLIVGLGRWGRQVAEQTWLGLRARSRDHKSDIPYVSALVIDMEAGASDIQQELLPTDSYLILTSKGMQAYLQALVNDNSTILADIPERADPSKFETGSDADIKDKRLGSALILKRRQEQVENVFDLHLSRLINDHEWTWAKDSDYQQVDNDIVTVYLVAALDEVAGGGFLPSILEIIPDLEFFNDPDRKLNLVGVFTAFDSLNSGFSSANSFATIVELNGILNQWAQNAKNTRQLVKDQICYILEGVNEKGEPIRPGEGEKLVVQFLVNSVLRFPKMLAQEKQTTPSFNSFTQIEYSLPTEQIREYLCDAIGRNIASPSGLLRGVIGEKSSETLRAQFQAGELRVDPNIVLGDSKSQIFEESIFMGRVEQQRILFSIPAFHEIIKASGLYQSLTVVQEKQRERLNYFQAYKETLGLHIRDRVVPSFNSKITGFINNVVASNPDGLELSLLVAQKTKDTLLRWNKQISLTVDKEDQTRKSQRAEEIGKRYQNIVTEVFRPSLLFSQSVWTAIFNGIVWLLIFAGFLPDVGGTGVINLIAKITRGLLIFTTPLGWFIPVLLLLFSIKYTLEGMVVGRFYKISTGYVIPGVWNLVFSAIWPALVSAISFYTLYRQVAEGASASLNLLPDGFLLILVIGTAATGIVSSVLYGWFFYRQINGIKDSLVEWVNALEESANYDFYLLRYKTAETLYVELASHCDRENKRISEYKNTVLQLQEHFSKRQNEKIVQMQNSDYRFLKLAVASRERLEAIFDRDLAAKPDIQSDAFVMSLKQGEYLKWLDLPVEEKAQALLDFGRSKTADIFKGKNLVTFLAPDAKGDAVELRKLLLPQLGFFRDYSPQWSLYSQKGGVQVFAGVGDEDDVALRDALKGVGAVAFQAQPVVYETSDSFSLILTILRKNRGLHELEELLNYKMEYLRFEQWEVHTRRGKLLDPLPKLTKAAEKAAQKEKMANQPAPRAEAAITTSAQAREKLGVEESATPEEIQGKFDIILNTLKIARDGLLDRYNRYQHFSRIERGEVTQPNWFQVLELEANRNTSMAEVEAAYARGKKQLETCLNLLLPREPKKQGEQK